METNACLYALSEIPINEYYEYFGPTYQLDVLPSNMEDLNTPEYLAKIKTQIFENMRSNTFAPSVQMSNIPKMDHDEMEVDEDLDDPNVRKPRKSFALRNNVSGYEMQILTRLTFDRTIIGLADCQ